MSNITDVKIGQAFPPEVWRGVADRMQTVFDFVEGYLAEKNFEGKAAQDIEELRLDRMLTITAINSAAENPESIRFVAIPDNFRGGAE